MLSGKKPPPRSRTPPPRSRTPPPTPRTRTPPPRKNIPSSTSRKHGLQRHRHTSAVYNRSIFSGVLWLGCLCCKLMCVSLRFVFCCRSKNDSSEDDDEEYYDEPSSVPDSGQVDQQNDANGSSSLRQVRITIEDMEEKPPPPPLTLPQPIIPTHELRSDHGHLAARAIAVPPATNVPQMLLGGLGGV